MNLNNLLILVDIFFAMKIVVGNFFVKKRGLPRRPNFRQCALLAPPRLPQRRPCLLRSTRVPQTRPSGLARSIEVPRTRQMATCIPRDEWIETAPFLFLSSLPVFH
ncbi:hypothetical protein K469DRAFT_93682 [Zopfia rhizophila CBS 207.26]|uniref:Uncharacterized protein n=1 Tax=Zopfia rhizophila CBS 207.26 TaxID=1314779 RepID=A0A6A6ECL5_9PEZI|nr:hypothetical protein K469DRAFT_93682 [Zopfia rhizophila CBS 207.26]